MSKIFKHIRSTLLDEIHQLFLFIPVFMGIGSYIYLKYFFQNYSPLPFIGLTIFFILSIIFRKKHYINLINISILCFLIGICSAEIKTKNNDFSIIKGESNIEAYIEGRVDKIIRKDKKTTLIVELNHNEMEDAIGSKSLAGVKNISAKITSNSTIPNKNDVVYLKGILNPPTPSVMKGAYNFQKDAYFKNIGAYGYATTKIYFRSQEPSSYLENFRKTIRNNIDKAGSNEENKQLIKALMLGEKKAIPKTTVENFRASGISHLLSISGLHIGILFGFIFLFIRCLLALNQRITLNYDIKKISAAIAIITTLYYVILVGYPMPTVRAFIMTFIIFLGIMFHRRAISMRNVAIAGILILLFAPNSILSASFQMSFSAVIALVAAYELISKREIHLVGAKGYLLGIIFTSFIAILATTPFAIYNFQNFTPYGMITNLIVMPIVSLIMPLIVLSYILLPIGIIELPLKIIDLLIGWIANTSEYIAGLKYSYLLIAPFPTITLGLLIFAGLSLCLFKHKLRFIAVPLLILALITNFTNRDTPDIIISPYNKIIAVRSTNRDLTFSNIKKEKFISDLMRKINGQKELLPFSDNKLITCNEECIYKKDGVEINLNDFDKKPYARQLYIKDGDIRSVNIK